MLRGEFVSITPVDENGQPMTGGVQGVYVDDNSDGTIQIQGESGSIYHGTPTAVVPDSTLFPNTLRFVQTLRRQNALDYRWKH
jgi:hypothetical protein